MFASSTFEQLTGYTHDETVGHNCRFLQGASTRPEDIDSIRAVQRDGGEGFVRILNYTKAKQPFLNFLVFVPLRDASGETQLILGALCAQWLFRRALERAPTLLPLTTQRNPRKLTCSGGASGESDGAPLAFSSDYVKNGLLLLRTVKSDTNILTPELSVQLQFELAQPLPDGVAVFVGVEMAKPLQLSLGARVLATSVLRACRAVEPTLHHRYGSSIRKVVVFCCALTRFCVSDQQSRRRCGTAACDCAVPVTCRHRIAIDCPTTSTWRRCGRLQDWRSAGAQDGLRVYDFV